jgi:hypothetical protein
VKDELLSWADVGSEKSVVARLVAVRKMARPAGGSALAVFTLALGVTMMMERA